LEAKVVLPGADSADSIDDSWQFFGGFTFHKLLETPQ
jgi:hypothetical protein